MRLNASRLRNAILRDPGGFLPAPVLVAAALLAGMHLQAQAPAANQPANAARPARQIAKPNAAPQNATPGAAPATTMAPAAAVAASADVIPMLRQNLPQDPLRVAIQNAVQRGEQQPKATLTDIRKGTTQGTPIATGNASQINTTGTASTASTAGTAGTAGTAANAAAAGPTLMCSGTRPNGSTFNLPFDPSASPAPAAGDACIPTGQKNAKGTAVMSTARKTGPLLAVVVVPANPAAGASAIAAGASPSAAVANTSAAATANTRLVCQGTRPNGTNFLLPFDPSAGPAPAVGDACTPTGQKNAKGTVVMSAAPKTGPLLAVLAAQNSAPSTPTAAAHIGPPAVNRAPNPAAAPAGPVPPAINAGIQSMVSAKASLEMAGNKWGGHKEPAIKLIDQALEACGQTATPDTTAAKPNAAGETAAMEAALKDLTAAQNHFNTATNAWGGRRDQAKPLISQAISELNAAIAFAKSHNTY